MLGHSTITIDAGDSTPSGRLASTAARMTPEEASMDGDRFDRIVITFGRRVPRRSVLGVLSALALTGRGATTVAAQACVADGEPCGKGIAASCCSGVCAGKKDKSKKGACAAAPIDQDQGICTHQNDVCTSFGSPDCQAAGATDSCKCLLTRTGASFCSKNAVYCHVFGDGRGCESDAECEVRPEVSSNPTGFPKGQPGDRCVRCEVNCINHSGGWGCAQKCPNPATA
jgi:hypothetical protein